MDEDLHLYAPEFLFKEFRKYEDLLLEKTHREEADFKRFIDILRKRIHLVPKEEFGSFLDDAEEVVEDGKDRPYVALALEMKADIWSDDNHFTSTEAVTVWRTHQLVDEFF